MSSFTRAENPDFIQNGSKYLDLKFSYLFGFQNDLQIDDSMS